MLAVVFLRCKMKPNISLVHGRQGGLREIIWDLLLIEYKCFWYKIVVIVRTSEWNADRKIQVGETVILSSKTDT